MNTTTETTGTEAPAPAGQAADQVPATTTATSSIEARLARLEASNRRLERSNRRWRFGAAAAVVVMVGMGAVQGGAPDEIRAKCFVVENYAGESRGIFGFFDENDKTGALILATDDRKGSVTLNPGNPKIQFIKATGETVFIE